MVRTPRGTGSMELVVMGLLAALVVVLALPLLTGAPAEPRRPAGSPTGPVD